MNEKLSMVLIATVSQNERLFKVSPPTGSHVVGSIKEMAQDRHVDTTDH